MSVFSVVLFAVCGASLTLLVRTLKPELAPAVAGVTGALLLAALIADVAGLIDALYALADRYGLNAGMIGVLVKIIGVAYAAQFGAQVCKDSGESAIAAKVELCGRVLILAASLPAALTILDSAADLLGRTVQ